jgi:F0F1-type ATP synthase assembly protein I
MIMSTPQKPQNMLRYAGLASQWMVMLLLAVWLGYKLDARINVKALFIIVFPLLSLCVSLWQIIKEFSKPKQ